MSGVEMPKAPVGYVACRVADRGGLIPALPVRQVTHLVELDANGRNGGRPTVCGLTRFDERDPLGMTLLRAADLPGWGMGDTGVHGPGVEQVKCPGCWDAAPQPRLRPSLFDPVARLAELMPNWDGYQGKPPSAAVLKMTIRVLAALPPQVPDPEVLPSTDGGVLLEWDMSGVELLLGLDDQALHTAVVSIDGSGEQEGPAVGLHDAIVDALVTLADRA